MIVLYLSGALAAWWDIGMVSFLDRVVNKSMQNQDYQLGLVLSSWGAFWAILLILSVIGFLHFRLRFYSYVTKVRSIEMIMAVWLVGILLALGFKFNRLDLTDFVLLVPPIVFYTAKTFDFKWVFKLRYVLFVAILILPLYSYMSYFGIRFPETLSVLKPSDDATILHGGVVKILERKDSIYDLSKGSEGNRDIWIMEFNPELYVALGYPCANRYTDYRITHYKVPALPGGSERIFSRKETDRDVYEQFKQNPPDIVLDRNENFPLLQARYPQLLSNYSIRKEGEYVVYERNRNQKPSTASNQR